MRHTPTSVLGRHVKVIMLKTHRLPEWLSIAAVSLDVSAWIFFRNSAFRWSKKLVICGQAVSYRTTKYSVALLTRPLLLPVLAKRDSAFFFVYAMSSAFCSKADLIGS